MTLSWLQKLSQHKNKILFVLIVMLGFSHAMIYALVMPPWGLLDESQHFHYIQFISEEHRLPVMWQDQLSTEIVDSFFQSERYVTLGSAQMPDRNEVIVPGRLDSESYEAYQPPLYYLFLSMFYSLGTDDVLSKLFIIRFIGVLLSGVTLGAVWFSARLLFPKHIWIAIVATVFVALLPERAVSVSRVNNDVLLEVLSAISFYLLANVIRKGITWRRTLLLANVLALAILTKLSALIIAVIMVVSWFWLGKRDFDHWQENFKHVFMIGAIVSIPTVSLFIRNLILYHDLTGMNAFLAQVGGDLVQKTLSQRLLFGVLDLFRNSWVILWDGVQVTTKPSATILFILLMIVLLGIIGALILAWLRKDELLSPYVVGISVTTLMIVAISVLLGYVTGFLPTVQGRFLLPAIVPTAWLLGLGLWLIGKRLRGFAAATFFAIELTLGMSVLFFHSLPNYYAPRTGGFLGYWQQTVYLFSKHGLFWDKPEFIGFTFVVSTIIIFVATGLVICYYGIRFYEFPFSFTKKHVQKVLKFIRRQRYEIIPATPQVTLVQVKERSNWLQRLKLLGKNPLLWIGIGLFIFYLVWVSAYPPEVFWSLDEGGKFIHLKNIVMTRNLLTSINYPGKLLDQNLEFVPLYFWSRVDNSIYSWWAIGFPMLTIPFYLMFGSIGLYILPAGFGALSAILSGMIARCIEPQRKWLPLVVALITGLATPIAFYSTTFWEHTVNTGLFLGGMVSVLYAWKRQQIPLLFLSGALFSFATYFRIDSSILFAGVIVAFLIIRWKWAILLGLGYLASSIPWWTLNFMLTGDIFSRRWFLHAVSSANSWFPGVREAGWWFIPYTLFNAPKIGAFVIPEIILIVAMISIIVILVFSVIIRGRNEVFLLVAYGIIVAVSMWVLFNPEGYRSIHGVLLVAPHIMFATIYFFKKNSFQKSPFPTIVLGIIIVYFVAYVMKGWVASGGLQWGPRYLLVFYPLVTVATVIGFTDDDFPFVARNIFALIFSLAVLVGTGYQIRGMISALQTRQYYEQTRLAIDDISTEIIVTDCPWVSMVMPEIYLNKKMFFVKDTDFPQWMEFVRHRYIDSFSYVRMDLCSLTTLNKISYERQENPSGLTVTHFVTSRDEK